uniref:Uncharacterized protein n=1 Tax=Anguilla anguilla TaxID=7936 RepID=A0A0E9UGK4_ANGAN
MRKKMVRNQFIDSSTDKLLDT